MIHVANALQGGVPLVYRDLAPIFSMALDVRDTHTHHFLSANHFSVVRASDRSAYFCMT